MTFERVNLADPNYEPTDEDLRELSREAFADVALKNAEALARLGEEIEELRRQVLASLGRPPRPASEVE